MICIFAEEFSDFSKRVQDRVREIKLNSDIIVETSGTTGQAKKYTKSILSTIAKKKGGKAEDRFILTFDPARWAGVSVLTHCLAFGCSLIVPKNLNFVDIIEACRQFTPTHVSLTPTMLRSLLLNDSSDVLKTIPFKQVTFGGEAATQSVLDLASRLWPAARITHTYASSEHGDVFAVSDGLEGVPEEKFSKFDFRMHDDIAELVINGELTGDLWQKTSNNRLVFIGRTEEVINVGGNKVSPLKVEEAAIQSGAFAAKAFAIPSPLTGSLVGLEYVGKIEPVDIIKAMRSLLPKYACPGRAAKVEKIDVTDGGKLKRI